jgi:hypothetical protein
MVRENLIQNVRGDRESCRINSVTIGMFAEVLRKADGPDGWRKSSWWPELLQNRGSADLLCRLWSSELVITNVTT